MVFSKYTDLNNLNTNLDIEQEILILQKRLLNLKFKHKANKNSKTHMFTHIKRSIAQLMFKNSLLINKNISN
jgi:ribosomal protein L29